MHRRASTMKIPWFIVAFLAAAGIRTVWPQGECAYELIKHNAKSGLTLTLFLIGAGLTPTALRTVGVRPLVQGILLWLVVSLAGFIAVVSFLP
jgi:uncharacterized membrane protein YadS